jgi:hypothetical protein
MKRAYTAALTGRGGKGKHKYEELLSLAEEADCGSQAPEKTSMEKDIVKLSLVEVEGHPKNFSKRQKCRWHILVAGIIGTLLLLYWTVV